jgi:4-hydroxybenzoate polyprenyltransferase
MSLAGCVRALWTLARPKMLPWLWLLLAAGYGYGHWELAMDLLDPRPFGWLFGAWTLLHVGTMWLNAWRDQDDGPVAFGEATPAPRWLGALALLPLAGCVALAWPTGGIARWAAVASVVLSLLYSNPWWAWKAHPIGGPLVNALGYGVLTPMATATAVGMPLSPRSLASFSLMGVAMMGLAFAAQAFQQEEDRARGDRTLVATHGPATTLLAARICLGAAAAGALLLAILGWYPRACLAGFPLFIWVDAHMAKWAKKPQGGGPEDARTLLLRLAASAGVLILAAVGTYLVQWWFGWPLSGMGTASGHLVL